MNSDWIFNSIDKILPFEVCLYHQVVPLSMEGSRIYLGMVNPDDSSALEYLRTLLSYLNCSLVPQTIAAEEHQALLTAYLNHTNQPQSTSKTPFTTTPPSAPSLTPEAPLQSIEIAARHLTSPISALTVLPPPQLLNELLARVLLGGIGRLHFARRLDEGRILWSQDGVPQSFLEPLPLELFQSLINELKRFAGLPLLPVRQQKEAELEREYEGSQVLLRLRVMRGEYGEEATLQVLRGAALRFYHQQKLIDLSQEALIAAQNLQKKLGEIRHAYQRQTSRPSKQLELLPALTQVLEQVSAEVENLRSTQG